MRGFTLVEVLIAIAVLLIAVVGCARMFSLAVVTTGRARVQTSTTLLAMQKLDELRALQWAIASGAPATTVSDVQADLSGAVPAPGGAGLAGSPADTLGRNVAGYVDFLDRAGQWVGTGSAPPAGAVFVRRWNVAGRAGDEANTLVLQVLVTGVAADAARAAAGARGRLPGDAWLVGVRTRVRP